MIKRLINFFKKLRIRFQGRNSQFLKAVKKADELHKKTGITVILVSHSMEDIAKYVDRIIVMNRGEKFLDGTPREVFAHYQELEEVGLAAPQVTYIMHDLRQNGLQVGNDVTTVEEAADEIMRYFRGKHPEETKL